MLRIGQHKLVGKKVALPQPLALIEQTQENGYDFQCSIKYKFVFDRRGMLMND
jgi:hypothetical protein